jgi:hypothetical protein
VAISETLPVAVPVLGVTMIFTLTFSPVPCVIPLTGDSDSVVVVLTVDTDPHFAARLSTFTVPNPVAMS